MTNRNEKAPAGNGGNLEKLLKIDDLSSLPGYADGLQAALAYSAEEWKQQAIREGLRLARSGERFTVENLRRVIAVEPESPKSWGAVIAYLRNRELVEVVNWTAHRTPSGESGVRVWRGTAKARTFEPGAGDTHV